ncbi:MAG: hypothetical protein WC815_23885 [Vicinamibacterales bacterium]|jgi:hypothetical protein
MRYISSQRYLDPETVETKKAELEDVESVSIPCSYVGIINGVEYAMVADKHHTLAAARELGLEIEFDVSPDPEYLEGEALLEARYIDSSYYNIETGIDEF